MQRITNQKLIVLDFLRESKDHPSADDVFLAVRKKLPRISKATVYRILDNFVKDNAIKSIAGKFTRFDGNTKIHQHFICNNCGKIIDLYDKAIEKYLGNNKNSLQNCRVKSFEVSFYGECEKCHKLN